LPESGIVKFRQWLIDKEWNSVYLAESAHEKAKIFQTILVNKLNEVFPEKERKVMISLG